MIKSIYIIRQNGTLIYSKKFVEDKFDDDILIGFFASIVNFSREALNNVIKDIDLGDDNKIALYEHEDERLLTVAMVHSSDDDDLIIKILQNITNDFIILFSPDYDKLNVKEIENILESNIKKRTSLSTIHRFVLSWIILAPISIVITVLNLMITSYYFQYTYLEEKIYTQEELLKNVLPEAVAISTFLILIIFIVPNLISGYITLDRNLAFLNSILYLIIILTAYFFSAEPLFFYAIYFYLPSALFVSLVFAYFGFRLGVKMKIVKK